MKTSKSCITCGAEYSSNRTMCAPCYIKKRKIDAAAEGLVYCTYCGTNHTVQSMTTPDGQIRAKCIASAKRRNATDKLIQRFTGDCKEFSSEREAIRFIEQEEYCRGHQIYVAHVYTNADNTKTNTNNNNNNNNNSSSNNNNNNSNNKLSRITSQTKQVASTTYFYCACHETSPTEEKEYVKSLLSGSSPSQPKLKQEAASNNLFLTFLTQSIRDQNSKKSSNKDKNGFYDRPSIDIGCNHNLKLSVFANADGCPGLAQLTISEDHNAACKRLAALGVIPQSINPELRQWISNLCEMRMPISKIKLIMESRDLHEQYHCPIPITLGPSTRYRPTAATMRTIASEANRSRFVDPNESVALSKLVEELKASDSIVYYNPGSCKCKVKMICLSH